MLFLVGLVLFVAGTLIIYCCYKRVWSKQDESNKATQPSPRANDSEYTQQWFQGRNLQIVDPNYTDDFKLRNTSSGNDYNVGKINAMNLKNGQVHYSDLDHYNEYMKMTHGGPLSVRSSASSNTTLSTMAPDLSCRDRSLSFGTTPNMSPINMPTRLSHQGHLMSTDGNILAHTSLPPEVENVSFYEIHRKIQRPVSLYSTGHVYEEIEEKIPYNPQVYPPGHIVNDQGILVTPQGIPIGTIASTPVYTNVVEDHDGYLIPSKSAKIINTPTGDGDPAQYLAMTGDVLPGPNTRAMVLHESQYQPQNVHIQNMNNLSMHQSPTTHMQIVAIHSTPSEPDHKRRQSNDSQLSVEQNYLVDKVQKKASRSSLKAGHDERTQQNPNLNTSPQKQTPHKTPSTTPNAKRQRMPLPSQPITIKATNSQTNQAPKFPLNQNLPNPVLSSILHQRTASLPDTSDVPSPVKHAKSPSLVPTPENYDVPRSLGDVPRTVNGSEISLDDIDGTIV